jgi:hypothetical protein
MGKAAKLKKIRNIAKQLPAMKDFRIVKEKLTGADLLSEGIEEVEGKKISASDHFKRNKKVEVPLNHYKQMKKYFKDFGGVGVKGYAEAIINHAKKNNIPVNV